MNRGGGIVHATDAHAQDVLDLSFVMPKAQADYPGNQRGSVSAQCATLDVFRHRADKALSKFGQRRSVFETPDIGKQNTRTEPSHQGHHLTERRGPDAPRFVPSPKEASQWPSKGKPYGARQSLLQTIHAEDAVTRWSSNERAGVTATHRRSSRDKPSGNGYSTDRRSSSKERRSSKERSSVINSDRRSSKERQDTLFGGYSADSEMEKRDSIALEDLLRYGYGSQSNSNRNSSSVHRATTGKSQAASSSSKSAGLSHKFLAGTVDKKELSQGRQSSKSSNRRSAHENADGDEDASEANPPQQTLAAESKSWQRRSTLDDLLISCNGRNKEALPVDEDTKGSPTKARSAKARETSSDSDGDAPRKQSSADPPPTDPKAKEEAKKAAKNPMNRIQEKLENAKKQLVYQMEDFERQTKDNNAHYRIQQTEKKLERRTPEPEQRLVFLKFGTRRRTVE